MGISRLRFGVGFGGCARRARQAAFWSSGILQSLRQATSSRLFALLRWLHCLSEPGIHRSHAAGGVEGTGRFCDWLAQRGQPATRPRPRPCEPGLEVVIRALLWNHAEKNESAMDRIALAFQPSSTNGAARSGPEVFTASLACLGQLCPALAYSHAVVKLRGDKYKRRVKSAAASMLNLPEQVDSGQLRSQLDSARRQAAELIGFLPTDLDTAVSAFAAFLDNMPSDYRRFEPALRRLGETSRGPQFLSASLLIRLVERSRF